MSIKQVLENQWIQKYNKTKLPEIRRKSKDVSSNASSFKIYATVEDNSNSNSTSIVTSSTIDSKEGNK
jgi:hypothetical protein